MPLCPKCQCGHLVEIGKKLCCLNCDYTCTKAASALHKDVSHTHTKVSFANDVKYRPEPQIVRTKTKNRGASKKQALPAIIFIIIIIMALFANALDVFIDLLREIFL